MKFEHINYKGGTGQRSKEVETYNYHKAAAVLAEYGFDCVRLADDWQGADFLAHHKRANQVLKVQLKSCLVIDKKYKHEEELYMCFPLDKTGKWYLVKHSHLMEVAKDHGWLKKNIWKTKGLYWTWTGTEEVRKALEEFAYEACHGYLGFRECTAQSKGKLIDAK